MGFYVGCFERVGETVSGFGTMERVLESLTVDLRFIRLRTVTKVQIGYF